MIFAAPTYIWLVIPVIVSYLLVLRAERSRQNDVRRLAEPQLQVRLMAGESQVRRRGGLLLSLLGMLLLVVALMRPQGRVIEEQEEVVGLDIVVALDVSRSMLADDLAPNRLDAAKKGVAQLFDHLAGDRVGLVAFAGSAFLVCPLTTDYAVPRQMLADLGPDTIPKGGSYLASSLDEARRAFRGTSPGGRVLVLVSDGEDHAGEIAPARERLRRDGVTVIAAQVGTREGGLIPLPGGNFVKDRSGAVVKSRANPVALQMLASEVVRLKADGSGLKPLLERARAKGRESTRLQKRQKRTECFQLPLAAALVLCSILLLTRRWGRP
jgi:Ca-activated chloride channel family protein